MFLSRGRQAGAMMGHDHRPDPLPAVRDRRRSPTRRARVGGARRGRSAARGPAPGRSRAAPGGAGRPRCAVDPLGGTREPDVLRGARADHARGRPRERGAGRSGSASSCTRWRARVSGPADRTTGARVDAPAGSGRAGMPSRGLLAAGSDAAAVGLADRVGRGAAAALGPPELERFAGVVHAIDAAGGLVRAADLARGAGCTVTELYRWSVGHLGVPPTDYLAAVRFSTFVREAVGPGVVGPTRRGRRAAVVRARRVPTARGRAVHRAGAGRAAAARASAVGSLVDG